MTPLSFSVIASGRWAGANTPNHALELKSWDRLSDRRQIRKERMPLHAGHAVSAEFPGADLFGSCHQADEHEIDLAAQQVGQRRRGPFVRDVEQVDAGHLLEFLSGEME